MLKLILILRRLVRTTLLRLEHLLTNCRSHDHVFRLNLCSGGQNIPEYTNVDYGGDAEIKLDLSRSNLPFKDNSIHSVVCMSAINYFSRARGQEIVAEVYRVLKPGGIARFGVQDMESIAKRYVEKDEAFFYQKQSDGRDRFEGITLGDKFASWFYGYVAVGPCKFFYDYESLAYLFKLEGFSTITRKPYRVSDLDHIELIDNRSDQMFFIEAAK
jgi:predicted SAM-dependent methyltransferase